MHDESGIPNFDDNSTRFVDLVVDEDLKGKGGKKKDIYVVNVEKKNSLEACQTRNVDRPRFCVICKRVEETTQHLFV